MTVPVKPGEEGFLGQINRVLHRYVPNCQEPNRRERYPHARWLPMELRTERREKFEI